jgi:hypothetical protein
MTFKEFVLFLKYFIPAFCLFSIVGFVAGWGDRQATAAGKLYQLARVEKDTQGQQYYLIAQCADAYEMLYSVDDNSVQFGDENSPLNMAIDFHASAFGKPTDQHMKYIALLGSFVGGPTAGFTYAKFLQTSNGKKTFWSWNNLKKNIYVIMGAITGYSLGDHLGKTYATDCDSELWRSLVNHEEMWLKFEKARLIVTLKEIQAKEGAKFTDVAGRNVYPLNEDPIALCNPAFNDRVNGFIEKVRQHDFDPDSGHFALLDSVKDRHTRLQNSATYKELVRLVKYRLIATGKQAASADYRAILEHGDYSQVKWDGLCRELNELFSH